ncbi:MAG: hypothetical protein NVS1B7_0490 [Candidatus Saccharimonadales bacterium]
MSTMLEGYPEIEQLLTIDPIESEVANFYTASWDFWIRHGDLIKSDIMIVWQAGIAATGPCELKDSDCHSTLSIMFDTTKRSAGEHTWLAIQSPIIGRGDVTKATADSTLQGRSGVALTVNEQGAHARRISWDTAGNPLGETVLNRPQIAESIKSLQLLLASPLCRQTIDQLYARVTKAETAIARFTQEETAHYAPDLFAKKLAVFTQEKERAGFLPYTGPLHSITRREMTAVDLINHKGHDALQTFRPRVAESILQLSLFNE